MLDKDYVPSTLQAHVNCYFRITDELFAGTENIFHQPYGCFEQVSSSTFPNIFALQFLKSVNNINASVRERALGFIMDGYKRLANYEIKSTGGFDWYGSAPAHTVLSAYGFLEFYEMKKVYEGVDDKMMKRTLDFILNQRDGKGNFKQFNGRYGFSGAPEAVNNAYIVYVLTETGHGEEVRTEYQSALKEAFNSKDMYRMALMANAAYNMKDMDSYQKLIGELKEVYQKKNLETFKAQASIVYSYDNNLRRECLALWTMALLKSSQMGDLTEACIKYISKGKQNGGYGSSQTTSLCLQALTRYSMSLNEKIDGELQIFVNDSLVKTSNLEKERQLNDHLNIDFAKELKPDKNKVEIKIKGAKNPLSYSADINWQTKLPKSVVTSPIDIATRLTSNKVKVNETVRLAITLQNTENKGQPSPIAIIGIPAGLSLQAWQLKELQEKQVFDYYEIKDDNLVLYYREMGPKEVKNINLDLKAEIPGIYNANISKSYLYYSPEKYTSIKGITIEIVE
jgi:uncharacterized protein YfaS (alpha-2-macroglobulin family)